jgi:hypothetical protein
MLYHRFLHIVFRTKTAACYNYVIYSLSVGTSPTLWSLSVLNILSVLSVLSVVEGSKGRRVRSIEST